MMSEAGVGYSVSPASKDAAGMGETVEHFFIETFIAKLAVEALNEAVLLRLASLTAFAGKRLSGSGSDIVQAIPVWFCHSRIARLVSSVPLSETMVSGLP